MDARLVGETAGLLGTARFRAGETVDSAAGLFLLKKPGEPVQAGEPMVEFYTNRPDSLPVAEARFRSAVVIGDTQPAPRPTILDIVRGAQ
jgi:thymidine phosphorylase